MPLSVPGKLTMKKPFTQTYTTSQGKLFEEEDNKPMASTGGFSQSSTTEEKLIHQWISDVYLITNEVGGNTSQKSYGRA